MRRREAPSSEAPWGAEHMNLGGLWAERCARQRRPYAERVNKLAHFQHIECSKFVDRPGTGKVGHCGRLSRF